MTPPKNIDKFMFIQGGMCFFCKQQLHPEDASIEHLNAVANGGDNSDGNQVACCKTVNEMLGSLPLKEKFQIVLNQKGDFKCPKKACAERREAVSHPVAEVATIVVDKPRKQVKTVSNVAMLLDDLRIRGTTKPKTLEKLKVVTYSLFKNKLSSNEVNDLVQQLIRDGKISVNGSRLAYHLT